VEQDAKIVSEIERLVHAQEDAPTSAAIAFHDGEQFSYRLKASAFGRELGDLIEPPRRQKLEVSTLTGFLDAMCAIGYDPAAYLVHVEDHLKVAVKSTVTDIYGKRETLLKAEYTPQTAFVFDQYYTDPQRFIIALQVAFLETEELLHLIKVASAMRAGNSVDTQDDGFSQTVTVKAGEVKALTVPIKPRIKLIPLRTFEEAAPVQAEFLVRFKQTPDQAPSIALFDVDGGRWKGESMRSIKSYLGKNLSPAWKILA
jgi:hypothetical protein